MDIPLDRERVLSTLLNDAGWRERVTEEFVLGAGEHVRVVTTFQFGIAREALEMCCIDTPQARGWLSRQDSVRLYLPLSKRNKRLLLNFDVRGPDGSGCLLPRSLIGQLQAGHMLGLFEAELERPLPKMRDLLEAICTFTPALFESFLRRTRWKAPFGKPRVDRMRALAAYLEEGLSSGSDERKFAVTARDVAGLLRQSTEQRTLVSRASPEPDGGVSSAEEALLALPRMRRRPVDLGEISTLLSDYGVLVKELSGLENRRPLGELADYGRRWVMIAELSVPIDRRFTVTISEDRPLDLRRRGLRRPRSHQRVALRETDSTHVEVRVTDPNVHLGKPALSDGEGREIGISPLDDVRRTEEMVSIYSADAKRPRVLVMEIELRLTRDLRATPILAGALAFAATVVALLLPAGSNLVVGVAVLAVPITVAAALLTVREQTALASRLQARPRAVLAVLLVLLWATVLVRLLWAGAALPPWHAGLSDSRGIIDAGVREKI